ncbi:MULTISPECIES: hypothetical protein [unclassified Beijerinckia]|uniref:hypothetical protein n=1 Tax=unclassified Beijerinckia TaxID=2638183 RepID=UPI000898B316|nr:MULTISPECIES: hypothetical protein [unclassified Beijerinckia]MDH7798049.1 hypothetical protein [Beijerinckia sp. GAS462]SED07175.1 hypothetical protein SAMN05443249_4341 [Beijerinckia sp. 28-YEA-48]
MNSQSITTFSPDHSSDYLRVVEVEADPYSVEHGSAELGQIELGQVEHRLVEHARDDMAFDVLILRDEQFRPRSVSFKGVAPVVPSFPEVPVQSRAARRMAPQARPLRRWPGRVPLVAAVALLGLSSAALAGRHQLAAIAPPTASVFSAIGLPANTLGVELRGVKASLHEADGQSYLIVEGQIANPSKARRKIGELQLLLQDNGGREIYRWSMAAPVTRLDGGETASFKTRLAAPLREASDVLVRFAKRG